MESEMKNEFIDGFCLTDTSTASTQEKKECRVLKILHESTTKEHLKVISNLKSEEYPNLFAFFISIEAASQEEVNEVKLVSSVEEALKNFGTCKQKILILKSKENSKFFLGNEKFTEHHAMSAILPKIENDGLNDQIVDEIFNLPDFPTILKFIQLFRINTKILESLLLKAIAKGSNDNFLEILKSPFKSDEGIIKKSAEFILSETIDSEKSSILYEVVKNGNKEFFAYLISNWTHLIQQLPFDHRVEISTKAFVEEKYEILCDLLKFSDFPFPKNLKDSPLNHPRLRDIVNERTEFHSAISEGNDQKIFNFTSNKFTNLKLVFNLNNETALWSAINSKQFKVYALLKSHGFAAEEFYEIEDIISLLTPEDKKQFYAIVRDQTDENVRRARKNCKTHVHLLITRSLIHDRMVNKQDEEKYRSDIKKWFEMINNRNKLCSKFLKVASQCTDLQIIFDFKSESVENVDLRNNSNTSGATYPLSKRIFIGAEDTEKNDENKIMGVLIHEIGHYVMRLIYENNEKPYFKNDKKAKEQFQQICDDIHRLMLEVNDDECDGIISSVFFDYKSSDFHPELIVRPLQIYAQYGDDESKIAELEIKFRSLFDYLENFITPELDSFNLSKREDVRKLNESEKILLEIKNSKLSLKDSKIEEKITESKIIVITTNIPKLFLCDLYKHLHQTENLFDTINIFTSLHPKNDDMLSNICNDSIRLKSKLRVIYYCIDKFDKRILKLIKPELKFIIITSYAAKTDDINQEINQIGGLKFKNFIIDYKIDELTQKSQNLLFEYEINFQKNPKLLNEINDEENSELSKKLINEKIPKSSFKDLFSNQIENFKEVVDDQLLNMLVEKSEISINSNFCDDIIDPLFNKIFQPRTFNECEVKNSFQSYYSYNSTNNKLNEEKLKEESEKMKKILIYDISGSGKSWILQKFTNIFREKYKNNFLMLIDLKKLNARITNDLNQDESKFWNFQNDFEWKIFKKLCECGKVFIFFDGFENITLNNTQRVVKFINKFPKNGRNQLWITTRNCSMQHLLNNVEFDGVYKLEEFSNENGINLIAKIKEIKEKFTSTSSMDYARYLCDNILRFNCQQIGLPQIYQIIAHVNHHNTNIPIRFLAFDVLEEFVKNYWKKPKDGKGLTAEEIHQYFAIKDLFPDSENYYDSKHESLDWTDQKLLSCGFLVKKNDKLIIDNKSVRDFFVADFIVTVLLKSRSAEKNVEYFNEQVLKVLTDSEFGSIRMFLNGALANKEVFNKLAAVITKHNEKFVHNVDRLFAGAFNEDLINVVNLLVTALKDISYEKVKSILIENIEQLINQSTDKDNFNIHMTILMKFLNDFDVKDFIFEYKIFKKIICSNLDIDVYENLIAILKSKMMTDFVRHTLRDQENDGTILHLLCRHKKFNVEIFLKIFKILEELLENSEVAELLNAIDEKKMNVLHSCVVDNDEEKFKFIWTKCKEKFSKTDDENAFKNFVIPNPNENDLNILQIAAINCNDVKFFQILWNFLMELKESQEMLKGLLLEVDNNGDNFLHLLIKHQNFEMISNAIIIVKNEFDNKLKIKEIFRSKNASQMNLLHLIVQYSNDLECYEFLWNFYKEIYDKKNEFLQILEEIDDKSNNIVHFAVFKANISSLMFVIKELEEITSNDVIKMFLTNSNNDKQNVLQFAAVYCKNIEIHQTLWQAVHKYLNHEEIVEVFKITDKFGNNVFFSAVLKNNKNIAKFIWNQVVKVIENTDELNTYLKEADGIPKNDEFAHMFEWVNELRCNMIIKHPYGEPKNILKFSSEQEITFENSKLSQIFEHPELQNRKIVAFSVIGAFRGGKSFFLNYCLRYLYAHYRSINYPENPLSNPNEWIGDENESLKGFSWRSGTKRDTVGITFWNDVFLHTDDYGKKLAIVVFDTQGLFDHQTTPVDNTRIFALSTLLSSTQTLNISRVLQEDQLQYLHFTTEFAKVASENPQDEKCFQNLMFLIRDWENPNDYDYGMCGGRKYLDTILATKENQSEELKSVREFIHETFDDLSCFLLPHPGRIVAIANKKDKKYIGNHGAMDQDFKDELVKLIEHLFDPTNLITKKVNQNEFNGTEFLTFAQILFDTFKSKQIPNVPTIFETIIVKQMQAIVNFCYETFKSNFNIHQQHITEVSQVEIIYERSKYHAMCLYNDSNKVGKPQLARKFKEILELKIKTTYEEQRNSIINQIEEKKKQLKLEIDKKDAKVDEIIQKLVEKDELIQKLNQELKHERETNSQNLLNSSKITKQLNYEIEELKQKLVEKEEFIHKLESENDELKKNLSKYEQDSLTLQSQMVMKDTKLDENQQQLNEKDKMIQALNQELNFERETASNNQNKLFKDLKELKTQKEELEQHKSKQEEYVQKLKSKIDKLNENIHKDKENYNLMMVEKDILIESLMDEIKALKLAEAKREEARIAESYEEFIAGHTYGKSVHLFKLLENNTLVANTEALSKIFEHHELKDRKIVSIAFVGSTRKGKSFLLNYCLRYLHAHYPSINCPNNPTTTMTENWMRNENEPLTGFSWRSGSTRDTSGIVVWNDAFLFEDSNTGDKFAIILIDTQGFFSSDVLLIDDLRIYYLGILLSSTLVLNMVDVIQNNQLKRFQEAIQFAGSFTQNKKDCGGKPFQHLLFLMRDWDHESNYPYGTDGGRKYLKSLSKPKNEIREFSDLYKGIENSYEEISCSLLPCPENTIFTGQTKTNKKYNGNWAEMDEDFRMEIKKFIEYLFSVENLYPIKVNGIFLKAEDYVNHINKCIESFQSLKFFKCELDKNEN